MPKNKGYTAESLKRALSNHESRGVIYLYSPPEPGGRQTWRISLSAVEVVELTTPQVYAFCLGLAAAERTYKGATA